MYRRRAKTLYIIIAAVLCLCTTAQNRTKANLGQPCQAEQNCVSGGTCFQGKCICKGHDICARRDRKQVCRPTPGGSVCTTIVCESQNNCSFLQGTSCDLVDGSKFCIAVSGHSHPGGGGGDGGGHGGGGDGGGDDGEMSRLASIMKLGFVVVGGSIFITTACLLCIITGKCSGTPGTSPVKERGVEYLKMRIPPSLGGTKPPQSLTQPPPGKSPSAASAAPEAPSGFTEPSVTDQQGMGSFAPRPPSDTALSEATASEVSSVATESVVSAASEASTKA